MATYVVGDVQGCFQELVALVKKINFKSGIDQIWFVGDLINRGPDSLQTVQYVKALGDSAVTILGNHELSALAYWRLRKKAPKDLESLFHHPEAEEIMNWMEGLPLAHYSPDYDCLMVHAGVPRDWSLTQTMARAAELQMVLKSPQKMDYYRHMYGDHPSQWSPSLKNWDRIRFITNAFTRMRYCYNNGALDMVQKGPPATAPDYLKPWFELKPLIPLPKIVFGHWAALMGKTHRDDVIAVDTGCVWGYYLSAYRLEDGKLFQVKSQQQ